MVVLVNMGYPKIQTHLVQKIGLWQCNATRPEIGRHIKHETVGAALETAVVIQQAVGVAAILIKLKLFDQGRRLAVRGVKRNPHAGSRGAVHRVEYVCAQSHGVLPHGICLIVEIPPFRQSVYTFFDYRYHHLMESPATSSTTRRIVETLTQAIVEHRLQPGTKLAEQKLASLFGVSRTLVRQALFQLAQNRLVRLEPARGAFVAAPSLSEAKQIFAVRRMLELEMTRAFIHTVTPAKIKALQRHVAMERSAVRGADICGRTRLLGDFHVRMAELMGNDVLAQMLTDLISRCSLITLLYQSSSAAKHSNEEHADIVRALAARDETLAIRLMDQHLQHVETGLKP